jgi:hypothetical protein
MLIWVASFPRSGNALLRLILKSVHGIASYTPYRNEGFSQPWDGPLPPPATALSAARIEDLVFMKTHELRAADDPSPAVYLVRDGRDAYVSYAHFAMQSDPGGYPSLSYADVLRMLIRSRDHFGGWSGHVEAWTRRRAPTAIVPFEDLVADPAGAAARACARLGLTLPAPSGRAPSFEELRAWDPRSFRKGQVGSWKEEMPAELEQLFWTLHGATMTRLGYRREGFVRMDDRGAANDQRGVDG